MIKPARIRAAQKLLSEYLNQNEPPVWKDRPQMLTIYRGRITVRNHPDEAAEHRRYRNRCHSYAQLGNALDHLEDGDIKAARYSLRITVRQRRRDGEPLLPENETAEVALRMISTLPT